MENIILFRFHGDFEACKERIRILQRFNSDTPIYGLYGGPKEKFDEAKAVLSDFLVNLQISSGDDRKYKWFHADQILKEWFLNYGKGLDFTFLYDYESDILTLKPLDEIYPRIGEKTIALSGVEKLEDVREGWNWTSKYPYKKAFEELCRFMGSTYGVKSPTWASLGPGPYFPKSFLEDFSSAKQPEELIEQVISEIMYPYYAEVLGYEIVNTGLHPRWSDIKAGEKYFNCNNISIEKETIIAEAQKPDGVQAFHPVKYSITLEEVMSWLE